MDGLGEDEASTGAEAIEGGKNAFARRGRDYLKGSYQDFTLHFSDSLKT
jgi:hypothetical protein